MGAIGKECAVVLEQADRALDKIKVDVTESRLKRRKDVVIEAPIQVFVVIIGRGNGYRQRNPTGLDIGNMAYAEIDNFPPKKMTINTRMPKNQPHSMEWG